MISLALIAWGMLKSSSVDSGSSLTKLTQQHGAGEIVSLVGDEEGKS